MRTLLSPAPSGVRATDNVAPRIRITANARRGMNWHVTTPRPYVLGASPMS